MEAERLMFGNAARDREIVALKANSERLAQMVAILQSRFDAWFDLVAADLGYEGATTWLMHGNVNLLRSPREVKTKTTVRVERKKTARCKGKKQ